MSAATFRIEKRPDGVAVLWMDVPGEPVNSLNERFATDFAAAFDAVESDPAVRAVVFASGKQDSFIVGADVRMLAAVKTALEAEQLSREGQRANDRIAGLPKPVVAAIHGPALGGGLEVAMACHGRVASDAGVTKLGLPEAQLGLLPGAGGTQRLPRLIGVQPALDLILTGKQVDARSARKLGLVDDVVPPAILLETAARAALALVERAPEPEKHGRERLTELALTGNPLGRKLLFDQARKKLHETTRGLYPAQDAILDVVREGLEDGMAAGLAAEARAFGALVVSPEAESLMGLFFATTALKKDTGVDDAEVRPRKLAKVGVLGAGLMGAGIAFVTATSARTRVRLKDRDANGVLAGLRHLRHQLDARVKRRRMSPVEADHAMLQMTGTTSYEGFERCDVVIEAVFEDLELKRRVLREVEEHTREDCIFASNTSSLPIASIAEASRHPATVIGMHYFSPVEKMPLLEIVVTDQTAPWVTATCAALGKKQGKHVIVVRDGVGFYTTRVLAPLMGEAAHLIAEGVPIDAVDRAMLAWGFPVGPIKLTDEVGIDVGYKVGKILAHAFGERMTAPESLGRLVEAGRLGKKSGKGFYLYGGKDEGVDPSVYEELGVTPSKKAIPAEVIQERCALAFVNEACRCFGEGILRSARDGDVGAVFGLGFPPFRGGPFRYVDQTGAAEVVRRLERLASAHGPRFAPAPALVEHAAEGTRFHAAI